MLINFPRFESLVCEQSSDNGSSFYGNTSKPFDMRVYEDFERLVASFKDLTEIIRELDNRLHFLEDQVKQITYPVEQLAADMTSPEQSIRQMAEDIVKIKQAIGTFKNEL